MRGTVIDFFTVRGFGYLKDDEKDEYCFYSNDIQAEGNLFKKGDQVHFDLYKGRGTRAVNIRRDR